MRAMALAVRAARGRLHEPTVVATATITRGCTRLYRPRPARRYHYERTTAQRLKETESYPTNDRLLTSLKLRFHNYDYL